MATGREIVANLPGRTPMKIGNNNFFKDSIKKKTPENATRLPVPQVP